MTCLQEKWNSLCPDFFGWFKKKRSDSFVESVTQLAREGSDVCRLFCQNDIDSLHHVENMNQNFKKKTVKETIENIQKLSDWKDSEEVQATYGAGSYVFLQLTSNFLCQVLLGIIGLLSEKRPCPKVSKLQAKCFQQL